MIVEMEQYILGSHDSMTYLPVQQWYLKPFKWMAQCQSKTITEQYNYGVRLFDLRVRFNDSGDLIFAHGPITFKGDVYKTLEILNSFPEKVYCRILLESNSPMKDQDLQEEHFIYFCSSIVENYSNIKFFGGNRKYDWKKVYDFGEEPILDDKYSSTTNIFGGEKTSFWAKIDDICPRLYAKLNNHKILKQGTDKDVLFIDFIGVYE